MEKTTAIAIPLELEKLPIKSESKLTSDIKQALIEIIENEFNTQATVFDAKANAEKERIIDEHKKKVGFTKLVDSFRRAENELRMAKKKVLATGLTMEGNVQGYGYDDEGGKEGQKLMETIDKIVAGIKPATNYKNKVITRMLTASNYGEAMVIMRSVLGNGILPSLTLDEVK
ncbi:MAG: hypothetical protein UX36_C0006G0004 [Microgenomates group bacterium GW2011_GWC1_46_15]|nr:MAG: hypothetical protein UX36_C0006G0004 [Microgenomates group bacterium GW2011_GWC1_46_15]